MLLVGIVKKNGIMMVDFAIAAQREQAQKPSESHLSSLSGAISSDYDDHDGGADGHPPDRPRFWRRF